MLQHNKGPCKNLKDNFDANTKVTQRQILRIFQVIQEIQERQRSCLPVSCAAVSVGAAACTADETSYPPNQRVISRKAPALLMQPVEANMTTLISCRLSEKRVTFKDYELTLYLGTLGYVNRS